MLVPFLLVGLLASPKVVRSESEHPLVLVVSFDGFRPSYLNQGRTPFLESLLNSWSYCEFVTSVFPTITFTNHHSLATGVYSEVHGVVMNPARENSDCSHQGDYTVMGNGDDDSYWHYDKQNVVPIWTLNELHASGRHSGVMMWPGGGERYLNSTPTFYTKHNKSTPARQRIDRAIHWFLNETTPANLVMLYIGDPDATAHVYGPKSPQVLRKLEMLDAATRYLHSRLEVTQLLDRVNVLLVSDHGMTTVTMNNIIDLSGALQGLQYTRRGNSPILHFDSVPETEDSVYEVLHSTSLTNNFTVYRKSELLDRWHFKHNSRVGKLVTVADEGYVFDDFHTKIEYYKKCKNLTVTADSTFGEHGYDNQLASMRPYLIAFGPDIRRSHKCEDLQLVDVFPLVASLLHFSPIPATNGSLSAAQTILAAASISIEAPSFLVGLAATLSWTYNALSAR